MPMEFESPAKHNSEPAVNSTSELDAMSDVTNEKPTRKEGGALQSIPITQLAHLSSGAANRRWLILMEPVNALHIDVILGRKVNSSQIHLPKVKVIGKGRNDRIHASTSATLDATSGS